jgi:hypothetical protein
MIAIAKCWNLVFNFFNQRKNYHYSYTVIPKNERIKLHAEQSLNSSKKGLNKTMAPFFV